MRITFKFLIPSILLTFSSIGATPVAISEIDTFECTPLYLDGSNTKITIKTTATKSSFLNVEVYLVNPLYKDGVLILNEKFENPFEKSFYYDNKYTYASDNKIKLTYSTSKHVEKTISHNIPVANGSTYSLNQVSNDYTTSYKYLLYSGGKWSVKNEQYVFHNFCETYMPDYYHKINIQDFYITGKSMFSSSISYDEAIFSITNRDGVFNEFQHDSKTAYFPLKLVKGKNFVLAFKNDLYVDPLTLKMSPTKKEGFVRTSNIYFPRNEKRFEEEYECAIVIKKLGIDRSTFLTHFKYKSVLNIFGDCRNSEYCIMNND